MNGHSALVLYCFLTGTVGLAAASGVDPLWIILILLLLVGALEWMNVRAIQSIKGDIAGMNIVLFGKDRTGGLWQAVYHPKHGLVRAGNDYNMALAFLLQQGSQVVRAVAEAESYPEARQRLRPFLTHSQSEIAELRDRLKGLELAPSGFVKAE